MSAGWLRDQSNTIKTLNTFENRNFIRYIVIIFPRIFSALNRQKNKNIIRPRSNKQYSYKKKKKECCPVWSSPWARDISMVSLYIHKFHLQDNLFTALPIASFRLLSTSICECFTLGREQPCINILTLFVFNSNFKYEKGSEYSCKIENC